MPPFAEYCAKMHPVPLAGTATRHRYCHSDYSEKMHPVPLAGTATVKDIFRNDCICGDASRTPRGDGNVRRFFSIVRENRCIPYPSRGRQLADVGLSVCCFSWMHPVPLTGTATKTVFPILISNSRCIPYPSRGRQLEERFEHGQGSGMHLVPLTGTKKQTRFKRVCKIQQDIKIPGPVLNCSPSSRQRKK